MVYFGSKDMHVIHKGWYQCKLEVGQLLVWPWVHQIVVNVNYE